MTALQVAERSVEACATQSSAAQFDGSRAGEGRSQATLGRQVLQAANEEVPDPRLACGRLKIVRSEGREVDRLVRNHLKLVRKHAWQIYTRMWSTIELDDLVQIGTVALVELARRFEDRGTATFSSVAVVRVRGAMIDALRLSAPLSRGAMQRRRALAATRQTLERELGRTATTSEVANQLGMTPTTYLAEVHANEPLRYDALNAVYSDTKPCFADTSPDAFSTLATDRLTRSLKEAIAALPSRKSYVMSHYFFEDRNLHEIGRDLNLSYVRVYQLKAAALKRLRGHLAGWQL